MKNQINKISEQRIKMQTKSQTKPLFAAYARKSSEEANRQILSIDAQIDEIKKQFPDTRIEFIEESHSAAKGGTRPKFAKMIKDFQKGKYQGLIAWHPDRLARNIQDSAEIITLIKQDIIKELKFCNFTFEDTPEGIMMLQMIMRQAEYFSAKLGKDVRRGNRKKRELGGTTGGIAPIGYINKGRGTFIEPDPERFNMVKQAFTLMLTGDYTVAKIKKVMDEEWDFKTLKHGKYGGNHISIQSLHKVFRNPTYAGIIIDPHTGEMFKSKHKPMITTEEFDKIQDLIGRKGMPRLTKRDKDFPLRGFLVCGECGCKITAEEKVKTLKDGTKRRYRYYRCTHKGNHGCHQKAIREDVLQAQFDEIIDHYELSPELYELGMKALKEVASHEIEARDIAQATQEQSIRAVQKKLDNLLDLATDGVISSECYKEKAAVFKARLAELQKEQKQTSERAKNWYNIVESTLSTLVYARDNFNKGTLNDKRHILQAIGSDPILTEKKIGLTTHYWVKEISDCKQTLTEKPNSVRTSPQQMKNTSEEVKFQLWCGWRESNSRLILGKDT